MIWVRGLFFIVVCTNLPTDRVPSLLGTLGRVLDGAPSGESVILLEDFGTHITMTVRGVGLVSRIKVQSVQI